MNFMVLAAGRSGSTLLVNCLSSQNSVRCHHEPFNQNGWHKELRPFNKPLEALNYLESNNLSIPIHTKILSFIQKKIGIHRGSLVIDPFKSQNEIDAEGFKVTWAQTNMMFDDMSQWLSHKKDMKCIFLYRYDYLARFVSYELAHANRLWNSSYATHETAPFKISKARFKQFYDHEVLVEEKLWNMLTKSNTKVTVLSYERLIENPLESVNSELTFLGSDSLRSLETVTTKLVASPLDTLVINFNELESQTLNALAHKKRLKRIEKYTNILNYSG